MQHVLLIAGRSAWADTVEDALRTRDFGVHCHRVDRAADALGLADRQRIDLAFADLVLPRPGLGGAAALARLRELFPRCRTVVVTEHEAVGELLAGTADLVVAERPIDHRSVLGRGLALIDPGDRPTVPTLALGRRTKTPRDVLYGGKYRPIEELGRGGMGQVFRAEDTFIHRDVALKLLRAPKAASLEEMNQRMRREVTIAGRLGHPHVVTVHDAGVEGDVLYLVMELIEGQDLARMLRERGALSAAEAVAITLQVLDALGHAHALGFVHRDLKPANVLVDRNHLVKVADFGLAKLLDPPSGGDPASPLQADLTRDEQLLGTPQYMAPEQFRSGEAVGPASDLYAVGLLLYEMLHGEALARRVRPLARALALRQPDRDPPLPIYPGDPRLQAVLERSLALFPESRFPTARAFAETLTSTPTEGWSRFFRWPFRRSSR